MTPLLIPGGGVLNTKVFFRTCRKHGSQTQAIRYVNGSLFIAKFGIFMGVIFEIFPNLRQNGANLSISSKILQISPSNGANFWVNFFGSKFQQFGMWMGPFPGSIFLDNWYFYGCYFQIPSGTSLPKLKLSHPPPRYLSSCCFKCFFLNQEDFNLI